MLNKFAPKACAIHQDRQLNKRHQPNTAKHMRKQPKFIWPAIALLVVWLLVAGGLTWQRSRESVIPPIWDQRSYVQKADNFWNGLEKGERKNPLNIEPTVRPPGTILLTAPLGPLKDYRNFYFRSVMVPVVITVVAVFIAGVGSTGMAWQSAAVALLVGSMPMFWQFESHSVYTWGLVDSFLASIAALAMACLLVAAMKSKPIWAGPALISLGLLPLIKPSGFLVAAMIGIAWVAIGARTVGLHPQGKKRGCIELTVIGGMIVTTVGVVALLSKGSAYFSAENMAFGNEALAQLREQSNGFGESLLYLRIVFVQGIGILPIAVIASIAALATFHSKDKSKDKRTKVLDSYLAWPAKIGGLILIPSVMLCYQTTLFLQPRYLFPFIAIAFVMLVPILAKWCKHAGKVGLASFMVFPFSLLIYLGSPSMAKVAQIAGGYGLYIKHGKGEIQLAEKLTKDISETRKSTRTLFHNDTALNSSLTAFIAGYTYSLERLGKSETQINDSIKTSVSWGKDPVITIDSIYNSDILALDMAMLRSENANNSQATGFSEERDLWMSWLVATPRTGSTVVIKKSPELLVLAVKDRELLEKQMRSFIASRTWRPEFVAANEPKNYAAGQLVTRKLNGELIRQPINFENRLNVHALTFSRMSGTGQVKATVYSERLPSGKLDKPGLFIHELDKKNNVVAMHEIPLSASRLPDRPISLDVTTFQPMPTTKRLGIGVYEPRIGSLKTNWTQAKDWGGRRARIDLDNLTTVESPGR